MSNSELLKNSRTEHLSKYLGSKRNKDMSTEKLLGTPNYVNPVTLIISTLAIREDSSKNRSAVQNVNEILNSLIISLVKNVNEYGTSRVAMNYIVALRNCETTLAIRSVILI